MLDALYIPGAARTRRACPHGRAGQPGRGRQGEARGRLAGPRSPGPGAGPQSRRAARLPPSGPRAGTPPPPPPRYRGKAAACPDPPASSPRAAAGCHAQARGFTCPRPGLLRPLVPPRQAGSHGTALGCQGSFPPFAARDIEASLCAGQEEPIKGCLGPEENSGEVARSCTGPREKRPHSRPRMEPKLRICPGGFPTGVHATEKLTRSQGTDRASGAEQYVLLLRDNSQCHRQGGLGQASTRGPVIQGRMQGNHQRNI